MRAEYVTQRIRKEVVVALRKQDTNGEFYSGFKEWEGTPNTEYAQLTMGNHNEPFKEGDMAMVVFTKTVGKDDKIYKNLKAIYPAGDRPQTAQGSAPAKSANGRAKNASGRGSSDAFGRRLAIHGFVNGMLAHGATTETIITDLPALLELEAAIDQVLNPVSEAKPTEPVKHTAEDLGEDIPFR